MHLEEATRQYWNVSSIRYGRLDIAMTVSEAIKCVTSLQGQLGPHRRLGHSVYVLSDSIVQGRKSKPRLVSTTTVATIPLR